MFYVYLIKSIRYPEQRYVGMTDDLQQRLKDHNAAAEFEQYLKSLSQTNIFGNKRL